MPQNIGRIIEFAKDKRYDERFKDLKKESIGYLNRHPGLVADYLKAAIKLSVQKNQHRHA